MRDRAALAARAAQALGPAVRAVRVLEIGAGPAPWSIALALCHEGTVVTALDLPGVLPATRDAARAAGVAGRFRFRPGDVVAVALEQAGYDLVLLGTGCEELDEATSRALLRRARPAVRPGGRLALIRTQADRGEPHPVGPGSGYAAWLSDVGLRGPRTVRLGGSAVLVHAEAP